jgi:4'-phosphopantetheinyl transferase EntD
VLVAAASRYRAVGIDLDDGRPLGAETAADLMTDGEVQSVVEAGIATDVEGAQRFVFSAKEAVYKCQYPLTGRGDLDFPDVRLEHAHKGVPSLRALVGSADTHADLMVPGAARR